MRGRVCLRWAIWVGSASSRCAAWRRSSRRLMRMLRRPPGAQRSRRAQGSQSLNAKRAVRVPSARGPLGRGLVIRAVLPCGQVTCPVGEIDSEFVFVDRVGVGRSGEVQRGEDFGLALLELLADFEVAVGGVAEHPLRAPRCGLLLDQGGGVVAVVLVAGRDLDRGDHRRLGVGGDVQLVAGEAARVGLAAVAHLGVVRGDDLPWPAAVTRPWALLTIDVFGGLELLADDLAQQPEGRADGVLGDELGVLLDGRQGALGIGGDLDQHRFAGGLLVPVRRGLLARAGVVEHQPVAQLAGRARVQRADGVDELADRGADERDRVLDRGRAEHRRRIDDLLDRALQQPELGGQLQRALKHDPLLAVQQQPGAELDQARRVKPRVIDRQIQRHLPAQVKPHRLHRAPVREPVAIGQQQHLGQQARRDRRPPPARRIALREVLHRGRSDRRGGPTARRSISRPTAPRTTPRQRTPADVRSRQAFRPSETPDLQRNLRVRPDGSRRHQVATFSAVSWKRIPSLASIEARVGASPSEEHESSLSSLLCAKSDSPWIDGM